MSIAALYASLIRWLCRRDRQDGLPPEPLTELIAEDRWIAQRYGVFAFFGNRNSGTGRVDIADYLAESGGRTGGGRPGRWAAKTSSAARRPS